MTDLVLDAECIDYRSGRDAHQEKKEMKKTLAVITLSVATIFAVACQKPEPAATETTATVETVTTETTATTDTAAPAIDATATTTETSATIAPSTTETSATVAPADPAAPATATKQ